MKKKPEPREVRLRGYGRISELVRTIDEEPIGLGASGPRGLGASGPRSDLPTTPFDRIGRGTYDETGPSPDFGSSGAGPQSEEAEGSPGFGLGSAGVSPDLPIRRVLGGSEAPERIPPSTIGVRAMRTQRSAYYPRTQRRFLSQFRIDRRWFGPRRVRDREEGVSTIRAGYVR